MHLALRRRRCLGRWLAVNKGLELFWIFHGGVVQGIAEIRGELLCGLARNLKRLLADIYAVSAEPLRNESSGSSQGSQEKYFFLHARPSSIGLRVVICMAIASGMPVERK